MKIRYKKRENRRVKIHFFDMDHTLIDNDCDVSWKSFVVKEQLASESDLKIADKFFEDYNNGTLDFEEFVKFQLKEFIGKTNEEMLTFCKKHFQDFVRAKVYNDAFNYIKELKEIGCKVYILTSTNTIIARSVADYLQVDGLLGTELELDANKKFTGRIDGIYAAQSGKVDKIKEFCQFNNCQLSDIAYYGDSINDKNILEVVGTPFAVNPSPELREIAVQNDWEILSFC